MVDIDLFVNLAGIKGFVIFNIFVHVILVSIVSMLDWLLYL